GRSSGMFRTPVRHLSSEASLPHRDNLLVSPCLGLIRRTAPVPDQVPTTPHTLGGRGEGFPRTVRQCSPLLNSTLRDGLSSGTFRTPVRRLSSEASLPHWDNLLVSPCLGLIRRTAPVPDQFV
ncbi:hypothetical protein HAX54_000157, partial [Datura stramonium]|nr:hypothetical protein [Datura stramonium]